MVSKSPFISAYLLVVLLAFNIVSILARHCHIDNHCEDEATGLHEQLSFLPRVDLSIPFPVYYINLDKSEKRRKRMERAFGALWDLRRFVAVDGGNTTLVKQVMGPVNYSLLEPFLQDTVRNASARASSLSHAEVGCILSHLLVIRKAFFAGHDVVMIVEDDISPLLM